MGNVPAHDIVRSLEIKESECVCVCVEEWFVLSILTECRIRYETLGNRYMCVCIFRKETTKPSTYDTPRDEN